ncbi:hypothetical protein [Campylobacter sp.]|uniref:hypothetical protein n=1 Tax=Campylobacter sp. TaxID=205 RepID=UPI0025D860A0|nr:hypothetical protein [Campylobacter sp.]
MQEKTASLAQGRPYKQKSLRRIVSRTISKPPSPPLVCAACRRRLAKGYKFKIPANLSV